MHRPFADHFGSVAAHYSDSRPSYPPELFVWLAGECRNRELAWDCGAGNGQASIALAAHFKRVVATDASVAQIAKAAASHSVEYRVALAEESGLPDACADIITVAQALHWFDNPRFFAEAARVLKTGDILAAWSYGRLRIDGDEIDAAVQAFYEKEIGPYWPPERRHVENGYRSIAFPFLRLAPPAFAMEGSWRLPQLLGYIRSWSATAALIKALGYDPVDRLHRTLLPLWGDPERLRLVVWPLSVLVGRKN